MRVFLTGATGFIGSRVARELFTAGHQVVGHARTEAGLDRLMAAGIEAHPGDLNHADALARLAEDADAVIHAAFDHEFSRFQENCGKDRRVIHAIGAVLAGSDRPFLITSGVSMGDPGSGQFAREDVFDRDNANPRRLTEVAGEEVLAKGVSVGVVRLPQVHDSVKQGLITPYVALAREAGVAGFVGDGSNRWCAAAAVDVAKLYVLALERHEPGARWHAVDEEAIPLRSIVEAVGRGLGIPARSLSADEAQARFGWLAQFIGLDMPASGAFTRERLGWTPSGPTLLEDLARMDYAVGVSH